MFSFSIADEFAASSVIKTLVYVRAGAVMVISQDGSLELIIINLKIIRCVEVSKN